MGQSNGTFAQVNKRSNRYAADLASQQRRDAKDHGNINRTVLWMKWRTPLLINTIAPNNELLEVMLDGLITTVNVEFSVDRASIFNLPGTIINGGTKSIIGYTAISSCSTQSTPGDTRLISKELAGLENTLFAILCTGGTYRGIPGMSAFMPHMTLSIPPVNVVTERLCFIVKGFLSKLILGGNEIDDSTTLRALAWELYYLAIEVFKLAHPATNLLAGLLGLLHRLTLVSLMSFKHVLMTGQPNMLGRSFEDTGRAEPLRVALTNLCINENNSLFVGDNSPPWRRESYRAIAAINQQLTETDETVVIQGIRLNARAISSPMMVHDIASTIVGCQGFIYILRQGRDNTAFICLLKWTMEHLFPNNLEMTASIGKSNRTAFSPAPTIATEMMFSPTILKHSCTAKYSMTTSTVLCRTMCWPQLAGIGVSIGVINLCSERNGSWYTKHIVTSAAGSNSPNHNPPLRSQSVTIPSMHHAFLSVLWPSKMNWSNTLQEVPLLNVSMLPSLDG